MCRRRRNRRKRLTQAKLHKLRGRGGETEREREREREREGGKKTQAKPFPRMNETSAVATRINDANIIGSQNVRPMPLQERGLATKGQLAASRQRATTCALSPALFHGPTLLRRRARVAPPHAPYTVALDCCATGTKGGVV